VKTGPRTQLKHARRSKREADLRCIELAGQVDELRQALWDVYAILGFDTDGNATPRSVVDLPNVVRRAAEEARADYDEATRTGAH
jgi:hypothetical protein